MLNTPLMTEYSWNLAVDERGAKLVTLKRNSDSATINFLVKVPGGSEYLSSHMNSLTDDHCEQWFDERMSTEERKAKQALRKERAKKERLEIEARVAEQKAEAARVKEEEKAAAKAKRQARQSN